VSDLRRFRKDDRVNHRGADPEHPPGPVVHLQLEDDGALVPRVKVTEQDQAALLAAQSALTWAEQAECVRRLNSILISRIIRTVEDGRTPPELIAGALVKLSDIAKKWTAEERAAGATKDPADMTDEELARRAG
jgi:hypothetical protein